MIDMASTRTTKTVIDELFTGNGFEVQGAVLAIQLEAFRGL